MFTFSIFDREYPFWINSAQKDQNCHFKLQFATNTNLHPQNSIVMFTFPVLNRKYHFWEILVQKIKIIILKLKFGTYNYFHNILRLFDVLPNFAFTTSETMRNYYL